MLKMVSSPEREARGPPFTLLTRGLLVPFPLKLLAYVLDYPVHLASSIPGGNCLWPWNLGR